MTEPDEDPTKPPPLAAVTVIILARDPNGPTFTDEELDELQGRHLAYLASMRPPGPLVVNGPLIDPPDPTWRGMSVYTLPREEALERAHGDPMVRVGRLTVRAFTWLNRRGAFPGAIPFEFPDDD